MFELKTDFPEPAAISVKAKLTDKEWCIDITRGYQPYPTIFHVNSVDSEEVIPPADKLQQSLDVLLDADLDGTEFNPQRFIADHYSIAANLSYLAAYAGAESVTQVYINYISPRIAAILELLADALVNAAIPHEGLTVNALRQLKHIALLFCGWTEQGIASLEPIWELIGDWVVSNLEKFPEPYHLGLIRFVQDIVNENQRKAIISFIEDKLDPGRSINYYGEWILFLSNNPAFCEGMESAIKAFWHLAFLSRLSRVSTQVSDHTSIVAFHTQQVGNILGLNLPCDDLQRYKLRLSKTKPKPKSPA